MAIAVRITAALVSLLLLAGGVFFVFLYYNELLGTTQADPARIQELLEELMNTVVVFGGAASLLFALIVYMALTSRVRARQLAFSITKDISFSRERFRRFYELSPVPYFLVTREGLIRKPNKSTLRFFGRTEEELTNTNLFEQLLVPDNADKIHIFREQVAHRLAIEQKECQVKKANGEVRWTLLSVEDLDPPGSGEQMCLATLVDIHEQKELERVKTEFLSLASHQLRAPLANLKWYIDFLLTRRLSVLNEEIQGYLKKMYQRNEDMIELVNTLLNLSRIEMGRLKVEKTATDIGALLSSVVDELTPAAEEKEITIATEFGPVAMFETDGRLLRVVVQNLLSNGIRYTNKGGRVLLNLATEGTGVRISVTDNGIGIPPDEQGKIFAKLYRASNAQTMEANGNGIGLYMCKALIESLGGTISFTSVHNQGTTFSIVLP